MDLLERYLAAVAAELPAERATDIVRELKANLLEELDALAEQQGQPLSEQAMGDFLQLQGHPVAVAQRYVPAAPLVAGEDMPLFRTVLWHSAALMAVLVLLKSLGWLIRADSINPVQLVIQLAVAFLDNFSWVFLVVVALFYWAGQLGWSTTWRQQRWKVSELPKHPHAKIALSDVISDLTSTSFLLLLLWTPLWMSAAAQQELPMAFAPQAELWRLGLTGLALLSTVFALYRLTVRHWQRWSLSLYIADHLLFAAAFAGMALQQEPVVVLMETNASWIWLHMVRVTDAALLVTAGVLVVLAGLEWRRLRRLQ